MSFSFQFLGNENSKGATHSNSGQPGPVRQEPQARQRSGDFQNRLEQLQKARTSI